MTTEGFYNFPQLHKADWIAQVKKDLKGKDFESTLVSDLWNDLKIQPFYTSEDRPSTSFQNSFHPASQIPGMPARIWSNLIAVYVEDEKTANQEIHLALQNGAEGLVLFLNGYENLSEVLKDVLPQYIQLYFFPAGENSLVFKAVSDWVSAQQIQTDQLSGAILWSPFDTFLSGEKDSDYLFSTAFELIQNWKAFPDFFPLSLDFGRYSVSGGTGIQELTFGLGELIELLDQLTQRGLSAEIIFANIAFQSAVGDLHFPEIAKLKALRSLVVDLAVNYEVILAPESIHLIASTCTWTYSILDKNTNLIRQTYQAMAGILGGCNSVWVKTLEDKSASVREKRIARNISTILREESYLDKVIDPAAGSFYLDSLQKEITDLVKEKVSRLEAEGGWLKSFSEGKIQQEIRENRLTVQEAILENTISKVGANRYTGNGNPEDSPFFEEIEEKELELKPSRASYLVELQTLKSL
jgi:methylmalonyl-CoA mutase